jgi:hypothetical protein
VAALGRPDPRGLIPENAFLWGSLCLPIKWNGLFRRYGSERQPVDVN